MDYKHIVRLANSATEYYQNYTVGPAGIRSATCRQCNKIMKEKPINGNESVCLKYLFCLDCEYSFCKCGRERHWYNPRTRKGNNSCLHCLWESFCGEDYLELIDEYIN